MAGDGYSFDAKLDDLVLDVIATDVQHGRSVHPHTFPKRDGAELEDSGREPWVGDIEVVFFDASPVEPGQSDYLDRFAELDAMVGDGEVHTLVHPYAGIVRGRISAFSHHADGEAQPIIRCRFTFTEDIALAPVAAAAAGVQTRAGVQDIRAEASLAKDAIEADTDLDADVAADAISVIDDTVSTAEAWESDSTVTTRTVALEMATINSRLSRVLDDLECTTNLARHPIMKQLTLLQYSVRRAAAAFTSTASRVVTITVRDPLPLRVVAARFYGAAQAERRYAELRDLNPALTRYSLIPANSQLRAYAPDRPPRRYAP